MKTNIINKGQCIKSIRTGKLLECYSVMPVYIGNHISTYEYHFWYKDKNKIRTKSIRQFKLTEMLSKTWKVITL
jgi:hypothetical protein